MRAVIQRVRSSSVTVDGEMIGEIGQGLNILLGVGPQDTAEIGRAFAEKIVQLRIFEDEAQKMNLSLLDVGGQALIISQFTLFANCQKGRRPSFIEAAPPALANALYKDFIKAFKELGVNHVAHGVFGADMKVALVNDGPVTICLDTETLFGHKG